MFVELNTVGIQLNQIIIDLIKLLKNDDDSFNTQCIINLQIDAINNFGHLNKPIIYKPIETPESINFGNGCNIDWIKNNIKFPLHAIIFFMTIHNISGIMIFIKRLLVCNIICDQLTDGSIIQLLHDKCLFSMNKNTEEIAAMFEIVSLLNNNKYYDYTNLVSALIENASWTSPQLLFEPMQQIEENTYRESIMSVVIRIPNDKIIKYKCGILEDYFKMIDALIILLIITTKQNYDTLLTYLNYFKYDDLLEYKDKKNIKNINTKIINRVYINHVRDDSEFPFYAQNIFNIITKYIKYNRHDTHNIIIQNHRSNERRISEFISIGIDIDLTTISSLIHSIIEDGNVFAFDMVLKKIRSGQYSKDIIMMDDIYVNLLPIIRLKSNENEKKYNIDGQTICVIYDDVWLYMYEQTIKNIYNVHVIMIQRDINYLQDINRIPYAQIHIQYFINKSIGLCMDVGRLIAEYTY